MPTKVKTATQIDAMREGGQMLSAVLQNLRPKVTPGISTKQLADHAARELKAFGGTASFLGYQGFPDVICISVNNEVVHGIPNLRKIIAEGDIVSLDLGVTYKGMITDSAISLIAGRPKQKGHIELVKNTEEALRMAIAAAHDRVRTGDIGAAVENFFAGRPYGIVRDLVGHGVGHTIHEDPNIPNYGRQGTGPWLERGMTVALEPMITLGSERVFTAKDGWTVMTVDGSWAAHFEHTVLITEKGAEILTQASP